MHCTQCGAPHEAHASVCAYCLSPKVAPAPQFQNHFTVGDVATISEVREAVQASLARSQVYGGSLGL